MWTDTQLSLFTTAQAGGCRAWERVRVIQQPGREEIIPDDGPQQVHMELVMSRWLPSMSGTCT